MIFGCVVNGFGSWLWADGSWLTERLDFDERHWIPACAGMTVVVDASVTFPPSS